MIFDFADKFNRLKESEIQKEEFTDLDIAKHAIQVSNLPEDENVEVLQQRIHHNLQKIFPPNPITGKSVFIKARVIGNYNSMYAQWVKLEKAKDKLAYSEMKNEKENTRRMMRVQRGCRFWCCGERVDE